MSWLWAVLVGHFLNALVFVVDKILLTHSFKNPVTYVFFIGTLGMLALFFLPLGFELPELALLVLNLAAGVLFIIALLAFFTALSGFEASRIVPFIGGAIPVFTLVFELLFIGTEFRSSQLWAFAILVAGTVLIAIEFDAKRTGEKKGWKAWGAGILAAVAFALSFGLTDIAYATQPFWSAFIWIRIGSFVMVLLFLLSRIQRRDIAAAFPALKSKAGLAFLGSQAMGAAGFMLINYAISLESVSIVNALQGVQYGFLLILAVIGGIFKPDLLKESMSRRTLVSRSIAVLIIGVGLWLMAFN